MVTAGHITGRSVLKALERTVRDAREQAEQLNGSLGQLDATMRDLVERRADALLDLAEHYLPEFNRTTVQKTFGDIRGDLLNVLKRKELRQVELQREWDGLLDERQKFELQLDEVTEQLNELVAQREELEARAAERLQHNAQFQELSGKIVVVEEELARNERRVQEIEQDAAEKLPSYERSRLFQYLHQRQYGTPEYKGRGLTKRWDRWVADLINFPRAKKGYEFLRVTPELMAAEVARRREALEDLLDQAEAMESEAANQVGLTDVLERGDKVGAQRDEIITRLERLGQRTEGVENELIALEGTQNEFYDEAIGRFKRFLESVHESALVKHSMRTPDTQDDRIVAEIAQLEDRLEEANERNRSLNRDFRLWESKISGLEFLVRQFRVAEYDSRRSLFVPDFDMGDLLDHFVRGRASAEQVWTTIRRHQRWAPTWFEDSDDDLFDILDSDFSHVLMRALAEVAGQALRNAAHRQMSRGSRVPRRTGPRARASKPQRPRGRRGGFTSGRGF